MPAGRPKKFRSGEQLFRFWKEFCFEIIDDGYKIAPTYTEFGRWLTRYMGEADRKTIYNSLEKYFPDIKAKVEEMRADVIAQGMMTGKYQQTGSIFALKNWCKWRDTPKEDTSDALDKLGEILRGIDVCAKS